MDKEETIMKKKLIILIGVSGVGKSTVSNILYEDLEGCFYLEGDKCGIMNKYLRREVLIFDFKIVFGKRSN